MPYSLNLSHSQEFATGLSDTEEARVRDTAAYMARRNLFTSGVEMERSEISRKETMRESAERISLNKRVSARFLAAFRSHKDLFKTNVKKCFPVL